MRNIAYTALIACLTISLLSACGDSPKEKWKAKLEAMSDMQKAAYVGDLYATAVGGAYLVDSNKIFYISNGDAYPVRDLPNAEAFGDLQPLSDGTAILLDSYSDPPAVYVLRGDVAKLVLQQNRPMRETAEVPNAAALHFVEGQRLARKLRETETELADTEEKHTEVTETDDADLDDRYRNR
jgi:hypothetical protein